MAMESGGRTLEDEARARWMVGGLREREEEDGWEESDGMMRKKYSNLFF